MLQSVSIIFASFRRKDVFKNRCLAELNIKKKRREEEEE
jgi:hypothetical protein